MARLREHLTRLSLPVGAGILLSSCALFEPQEQPLTTFNPAGPYAERLDELFWMVFWLATGVFVLVMGILVVIIFFFRDRRKAEAPEPKQTHGSPKLEVAWTVIPALILAVIAVPTVRGVFEGTECVPGSMPVEIIGHQWWFEFKYPDYGIDTANVLVIPAGQEICAGMTSVDVVHNFWVPALHGKRYLIPGHTTTLPLNANEPGEYWAHCAEFCGLSHSLMRARVLALEPAEFEQWVASQQAPAVLPEEGTPEHEGYQVFLERGCDACHTVRFDDEEASRVLPDEAFNGPELTHFASRNVFAGATLPREGETREEALKRWLADPPFVKPGSFMPPTALDPDDLHALLAYLEGLD